MRFNLVPKSVKEPVFWKNYFYRVFNLTRSLKLRDHIENDSNISAASADVNLTTAEPQSEVLFEDNSVDEVEAVFDELNISPGHSSGSHVEEEDLDWEAELQKELKDI